jgi:hypothetical protein
MKRTPRMDIDAILADMAGRLDRLEKEVDRITPGVEETLRRRGIIISGQASLDGVVLPSHKDEKTVQQFYTTLKSYYFRRLLAEVIEKKGVTDDIFREIRDKWGWRAIEKYFNRLLAWDIISGSPCTSEAESTGSLYAFTRPDINNFGETLEWFIAQTFIREFSCPALHAVRLEDSVNGGDFDVLVRVEWSLGYVECKSSPPYNVRLDEQREFLRRIEALRPDFAILLIDTTLDIGRNILDNLRHLLGKGEEIEPLGGGVHRARAPLYIMSSRRGLIQNIARCLRDFMSGSSHPHETGGEKPGFNVTRVS